MYLLLSLLARAAYASSAIAMMAKITGRLIILFTNYLNLDVKGKTMEQLGLQPLTATIVLLVAVFVLWDMVWKAIGLWKSARNSQLGWFIAIMVLNTIGILPIVYILWFQKKPRKIVVGKRKAKR
jgi:hypothetical protein